MIAAVGYHYAPHVDGFSRMPLFLRNLVYCGPLAVPFFFILSGFVLSHAYGHRVPLTTGARRQFWWGRVARLYPIYLLAWLLFLPMAYAKYMGHVHQGATFASSGVLSVVALQSWTPLSQSWNGPSWSLSVEMFFYFLFPFLALPLLTMRRRRVLLLTAMAWGVMLTLDLCHVTGLISKQVWLDWFNANPLLSLPTFLIGIVTYRVYRRAMRLDPAGPGRSRIGTSSVACGLGVLCLVVLAGWSGESVRDFLIGGGAAPLMAFVILTAAHESAWVLKVFGNPTLARLGTTSFIIYIMQAPVWHITRLIADKLHLELAGRDVAPVVFPVYLMVLVGLALLLQARLETPARTWLMRRGSGSRRVSGDAVAVGS